MKEEFHFFALLTYDILIFANIYQCIRCVMEKIFFSLLISELYFDDMAFSKVYLKCHFKNLHFILSVKRQAYSRGVT